MGREGRASAWSEDNSMQQRQKRSAALDDAVHALKDNTYTHVCMRDARERALAEAVHANGGF